MALIVEDGSIVSSANSYVTDAEYTTYAASRNLTIGSDSVAREAELILAMDFLEGQDFKGSRVDPDSQELAYPRSGVYANDRYIDSNQIPKELKKAQYEAAIAAYSQSLQINSADGNIQSQKLSELEVSYFNHGSKTRIRLDRVYNYLSPMLNGFDGKLVRT